MTKTTPVILAAFLLTVFSLVPHPVGAQPASHSAAAHCTLG